MLQHAASDQGLHCLPLIQKFYTNPKVAKWSCLNVRTSKVRSSGGQFSFQIFNLAGQLSHRGAMLELRCPNILS